MTRAAITLAATDATAGAFAAVKAKIADLGTQAQALSTTFAAVSGGVAALLGGQLLTQYFRQIVDGLDSLNDLKDATGASIGNLSALEDIAARTGTSFDTVSSALVKFNGALGGAKVGSEAAEVFKRLGLNIAELKAEDPAEAFRQVAVALQGFADDGNKARATQVLFGRSLREVAPLLKDVAEAGSLNATVTEEQAQAAETFNRQLSALGKNAADAGRSLVGDLLPPLNRVLIAFAELSRRDGPNVTTQLAEVLKGNTFTNAADGVAFYVGRLADLQRQYKLVAESTSGIARRGALIDLARDIEQVEKLERYYRRLAQVTSPDLGQSDPRELARRGRGPATASLGDVGSADKVREQVSEFEKYVDRLRQGLLATQEVSAEEQTRIDINRGLLGVLNEAQKAQAIGLAASLDNIRAQQQAAKDFAALQAEGARITESVATEQERLAAQLERVNMLLDKGAIGWVAWRRVVDGQVISGIKKSLEEAGAALDKAGQLLGKTAEQSNDFAKQAAANIQTALGDSLVQVFEGNSRRISDIWKNLLKRLAAEAAAAQIAKALFGQNYGQTGQIGGILGSVFGGQRALGGPVQPGRAYLVGERGPEILTTRSPGTVIPNSALQQASSGPASVTNINIQGDVSAANLRAIRQALAQQEARRLNAVRY